MVYVVIGSSSILWSFGINLYSSLQINVYYRPFGLCQLSSLEYMLELVICLSWTLHIRDICLVWGLAVNSKYRTTSCVANKFKSFNCNVKLDL